MSLNRRLEPLPEFETGYRTRHDALLLATVLVVGLAFVTPALSLVLGLSVFVFVALTVCTHTVVACLAAYEMIYRPSIRL